ncbi:MAG: hypothetical protein ACE5DM_01360 [Candidatus Nanoarchaeia archaeon]
MKKTTVVAIILGVLVLISVVQAVQLSSLKTKLAEGEQTSVGTASSPAPVASSGAQRSAALPSSVKNLPQMVGGC